MPARAHMVGVWLVFCVAAQAVSSGQLEVAVARPVSGGAVALDACFPADLLAHIAAPEGAGCGAPPPCGGAGAAPVAPAPLVNPVAGAAAAAGADLVAVLQCLRSFPVGDCARALGGAERVLRFVVLTGDTLPDARTACLAGLLPDGAGWARLPTAVPEAVRVASCHGAAAHVGAQVVLPAASLDVQCDGGPWLRVHLDAAADPLRVVRAAGAGGALQLRGHLQLAYAEAVVGAVSATVALQPGITLVLDGPGMADLVSQLFALPWAMYTAAPVDPAQPPATVKLVFSAASRPGVTAYVPVAPAPAPAPPTPPPVFATAKRAFTVTLAGGAAAWPRRGALRASLAAAVAAAAGGAAPAQVLGAWLGWVCAVPAAVVRAGLTPAMKGDAEQCRAVDLHLDPFHPESSASPELAAEALPVPVCKYAEGREGDGACVLAASLDFFLGMTAGADAAAVDARLAAALPAAAGVAAAAAVPRLHTHVLTLRFHPMAAAMAAAVLPSLVDVLATRLPTAAPAVAAVRVQVLRVCPGRPGGDDAECFEAPQARERRAGGMEADAVHELIVAEIEAPEDLGTVEAAVNGLKEASPLGALGFIIAFPTAAASTAAPARPPPARAPKITAGSTPIFVVLLTNIVGALMVVGIIYSCFCAPPVHATDDDVGDAARFCPSNDAVGTPTHINVFGRRGGVRAVSPVSLSDRESEMAEVVEITDNLHGPLAHVGISFDDSPGGKAPGPRGNSVSLNPRSALKTRDGGTMPGRPPRDVSFSINHGEDGGGEDEPVPIQFTQVVSPADGLSSNTAFAPIESDHAGEVLVLPKALVVRESLSTSPENKPAGLVHLVRGGGGRRSGSPRPTSPASPASLSSVPRQGIGTPDDHDDDDDDLVRLETAVRSVLKVASPPPSPRDGSNSSPSCQNVPVSPVCHFSPQASGVQTVIPTGEAPSGLPMVGSMLGVSSQGTPLTPTDQASSVVHPFPRTESVRTETATDGCSSHQPSPFAAATHADPQPEAGLALPSFDPPDGYSVTTGATPHEPALGASGSLATAPSVLLRTAREPSEDVLAD